MRILITSKNKYGDKAIQQHLDEVKKIPLRVRLQQKIAGISQLVIKEKPGYILELEIKNVMAKDVNYRAMAVNQVVKAFEDNGADKGLDYDIEVVD